MIYSEDQYGLLQYGSDSSSGDSSGGSAEAVYYTDLKRYLPRFMWEDFKEMKGLLTAQGHEVGRIWHELTDYYKQTYVDSGTWGLKRWEKVLGIKASSTQNYSMRRAQIKARLVACAVCTPDLLAALAKTTTGVDSVVVEDTANYEFTIYFIGQYGVPRNMAVLRDAVEVVKPAHLNCLYKYKYTIWNELKPYTWGYLSKYTWDGLRVMEVTARVTWNGIKAAGFTAKSARKYTWNSIKNVAEAKT